MWFLVRLFLVARLSCSGAELYQLARSTPTMVRVQVMQYVYVFVPVAVCSISPLSLDSAHDDLGYDISLQGA